MERIVHEYATEVRLSPEETKDICRLGQGEKCCAFLTLTPGGFECIRMSYPMNGAIFERLEKGTMNAKGEGKWERCPWEKTATEKENEKNLRPE